MKVHDALPHLLRQYLQDITLLRRGQSVTAEFEEKCVGARGGYFEPVLFREKIIGHFIYNGAKEEEQIRYEFCFLPEDGFESLSISEMERIVLEASVEKTITKKQRQKVK